MSVSRPNRRQFLRAGAALAASASLPENLRKALAIEPHQATGTIHDVEHIVILMQENRSFDHYFGTLNGVRGYGDPRANTLPDGHNVFEQPDGHGGRVLPFRLNTVHTSSACIASLNHNWKGSQTAWQGWDCWVPRKTAMTMGHFTREDIPYYFALADAFTICDAYHCSVFGPTNPNRLFLFTGTSGLAVGNDHTQAVDNTDDGNWSADITLDKPDFKALTWTTYAQQLQSAGVSWKVYQEYDNFGDNPLAQFADFRNVKPGSWQYDHARAIVPGSTKETAKEIDGRYLLAAFEKDIAEGTLPQVSWIVPSAALSEHPNAPPGFGEHLISSLMDVFVRHPETWSKTVFILNYDENDGFFDHIPAPVPAITPDQGASTVSTQGESYHGVPMGLGPRVPALIVSPWTKGGWVNSELFDHTSVLRFLEARFGVKCPNITPWRKSVCGDLTSVFDFARPDPKWTAQLPDTRDYLPLTRHSCTLPHPTVPVDQHLPHQERGQRPARPLPYRLGADIEHTHNGTFLRLGNAGRNGVVYRLQSGADVRFYTLGGGHAADIPLSLGEAADLDGPNGFHRSVRGQKLPIVRVSEHGEMLGVSICNPHASVMDITITDAYRPAETRTLTLPASGKTETHFDLRADSNWYDLTLQVSGGNAATVRIAGHIENGKPSHTDPLIGHFNPHSA